MGDFNFKNFLISRSKTKKKKSTEYQKITNSIGTLLNTNSKNHE